MELVTTFKSLAELEDEVERAKKEINIFDATRIIHGLPLGRPDDEKIRKFRTAWLAYKERIA